MKNILKIFTGDVNRLVHNLVASIIVIGVLFIPSLYAWFNIAANMDPYANTGNIKIAVSSDDIGTESDLTGEINAGDMIIEKLKDNDEIGWTFVSTDEAIEGVEAGDYFACIIIPENFSEDIISVLSGNIEQPEIDYYLNEKLNAIAPKVTDTGASTIQTEVNQTFVGVVSETLAGILNDATGNITGEMEEVQNTLLDDLDDVNELLTQFDDQWTEFKKSYMDMPDLSADTTGLLDSLRQVASGGQTTLKKSTSLLTTTRKDISSFTSKLDSSAADAEGSLTELTTTVNAKLNKINVPVQQTTGEIADVITSVQSIVDLNGELISGLQSLSSQYPDSTITALISELQADNTRHKAVLQSLKAADQSIGDASQTLTDFSEELIDDAQNADSIFSQARNTIVNQTVPSLSSSLDSFSNVSGTLNGVLSGIDPACDQVESLLDGLNDSLDDAYTAIQSAADALEDVSDDLNEVETDLRTLISSETYQQLLNMTGLDADSISDFMSSPIEVENVVLYPVENYGSGVTPFYTNLALWVSGIVLIAIFKMEVPEDDELKHLTTTETFFGRGLLFIVAGLLQALIIALGDIYLLKVQCVKPGLFILACLWISFIYVSFIYAMSLTFKHIGKALCVVLVILQIPGSAGTYPIEMTPKFFRAVHPLLPFTYGVSALRECVAGLYKYDYWKNLAIMVIYLILALFIGLVIRKVMLNLNHLFDRKLEETGFMICDEVGEYNRNLRITNMIRYLMSDEHARTVMMEHAQKFEQSYAKRIRHGFLTIIILPIIFLILLFVVDYKMVFLILWIASIVAIAIYLVAVEYLHEQLSHQLSFLNLSDEEFNAKLHEEETQR